MRIVFTTAIAYERGLTPAMLLTGERNGRWRKIEKGVWVEGPAPASRLDRAVGAVLRTGGVASGGLAARLHDLDSVTLGAPPHVTVPPNRMTRRAGVRRLWLPPDRIVTVGGIPCTDGFQTLVDLAPALDDFTWEQALESALRKGLVTIGQLEKALPALGRSRTLRRLTPVRRNPRGWGAPVSRSLGSGGVMASGRARRRFSDALTGASIWRGPSSASSPSWMASSTRASPSTTPTARLG